MIKNSCVSCSQNLISKLKCCKLVFEVQKIIIKSFTMKTYILMTKFSSDFTGKMKDREKMGRNWLEQVKKSCPEVKFIAHYALWENTTLWIFMKLLMNNQLLKYL